LKIMLYVEVVESELYCIFRLLSKLCCMLRLLKITVHVKIL
jgi:hypothetical protein